MVNLQQTTIIQNQHYRWNISIDLLQQAIPWVARAPHILMADLTDMQTYFPHWLLIAANQGQPCTCPNCRYWLVPQAHGFSCPICGHSAHASEIAWIGQLPSLARPEPPFRTKQQILRQAGFTEVTASGQTFLLVPLIAYYPQEWPYVPPQIRYSASWLQPAGLPHSHGGYHLIAGGQACIYGYGDWQTQTMAHVLQQRMVNHVASLFKIMAGYAPQDAFIGRAH